MGLIDIVIFEGGYKSQYHWEGIMAKARLWAVIDTIFLTKEFPEVNNIIVCSDNKDLLEQCYKVGAIPEYTGGEFHFGETLRKIINKYNILNTIYFGGGSSPLLTSGDMRLLIDSLINGNNTVISNNLQSSDIVAFRPASVINSIFLPNNDNDLAYYLMSGGLNFLLLPKTLGFSYDIDTPADLNILMYGAHNKSNLKSFLLTQQIMMDKTEGIVDILRQDYKEIALIGRINPETVRVINKLLKSRIRFYSEERGMKALKRENISLSLLGFFLEEVGPRKFFDYLSTVCDGALIDTRVIFSHMKCNPSPKDKYYSDCQEVDNIENEFIRSFTKEASVSRIPILLGGHNLVNGGIWALSKYVNNINVS